jgi:membrane protease YdiL (CAAX protease family)
MKRIAGVGNVLIAVAAVLVIPRLAGEAQRLVAEQFGHALDRIDPNGVYIWASIHHLAQLLLTIALMLTFSRSLASGGFNLQNRNRSLQLFGRFFIYYTAFVVAGHAALFFLAPAPAFPHPLNARNVVGELGFKLFLSGTCEEPLFRGFVMTVLYRTMTGVFRVGRIEMPYAGALATVLFMLAHVGYTLAPLAITWISPTQLVQACALGLFYAYMFHQTRSLLGPVLVHNYFNFSLTALGMLWALLRT